MQEKEFFLPPRELLVSKDAFFMNEALKEAKKAFDKDEVPIGAVIVLEDVVIARAHNQVEMLCDATAHAEMLSLTAAASFVDNWRLSGCTLYCTIEPCAMCAGACISSRMSRVVWGACEPRVGACGSWVNLFDAKHPIHTVKTESGVLRPWCEELISSFFRKRRKEKKDGTCNFPH